MVLRTHHFFSHDSSGCSGRTGNAVTQSRLEVGYLNTKYKSTDILEGVCRGMERRKAASPKLPPNGLGTQMCDLTILSSNYNREGCGERERSSATSVHSRR